MATLRQFVDAGYTIEERTEKIVTFEIEIPNSVPGETASETLEDCDGEGSLVDENYEDSDSEYFIILNGNIIENEMYSLEDVGEYIEQMEIEEEE